MKTFFYALAVVVLLSLQPARAASSQEETKFLATAKLAFEKHDADALMGLVCWDRVPDTLKESGRKRYTREVALTITDIKLTAPDPASPDLEWKDAAGVAHRSNLPVIK